MDDDRVMIFLERPVGRHFQIFGGGQHAELTDPHLMPRDDVARRARPDAIPDGCNDGQSPTLRVSTTRPDYMRKLRRNLKADKAKAP